MNSAGDHFTTDTTGTGHHRRRLTAVAAGVAATLALGGLSAISAQYADAATRGAGGAAPETTTVGFGAGTTGGGNATATTVTTPAAFKAAVAGDSAKVVKVSGLLSLPGQVDIGSHTTVLGVGPGSGVTGGGLRLKGATNVIIRDLAIGTPRKPSDGVTVQESTKVWIDHNTFPADRDHGEDSYDGPLDIDHGSDNVTVSWNTFAGHFHDNYVQGADTAVHGNDLGGAAEISRTGTGKL